MRLSSIEKLVEVARLEEVLAPVLSDDIVPPDKKSLAEQFSTEIKAFKRALERRAKGMPDDDTFDRD